MFNWLKSDPRDTEPDGIPVVHDNEPDTEPFTPIPPEPPTLPELLNLFIRSGYDANGRAKDE